MERAFFFSVRLLLEMVKRDGAWPPDAMLRSVAIEDTEDGPLLVVKFESKTMDGLLSAARRN